MDQIESWMRQALADRHFRRRILAEHNLRLQEAGIPPLGDPEPHPMHCIEVSKEKFMSGDFKDPLSFLEDDPAFKDLQKKIKKATFYPVYFDDDVSGLIEED